jgi:hypothetical protein
MKKQRGNVVSTAMKNDLGRTRRRKPSRDSFETISDIIPRLEDHIVLQEMNEAIQ